MSKKNNQARIVSVLIVMFVSFVLQAKEMKINQYPMWVDPGSNQQISVTGSKVKLTYGTFDSLSLVGTDFILSIPGKPGTAVDFCQARSAAGCGFQFTDFAGTGRDNWICNQAAGNSVLYQWGFHTPVECYNSLDSSFIKGEDWLPAYYDSFNEDSTSPLIGNSDFLYYLKRNVEAKSIEIDPHNKSVRVKFNTVCKWKTDTSLSYSRKTDAFYFNREKAKQHNMRIYMQGIDNTSGENWYLGPIPVYEIWTSQNLLDHSGKKRGQMLPPQEPFGGCWSNMDESIRNIVIVVDLHGRKIAFGTKNIRNGFVFRLEETTYGNDPDNYKNGSFCYWIRQARQDSVHYREGQIEEQNVLMDVGTPAQLAKLGFWVPE